MSQEDPLVREFQFSSLEGPITPNDQFYIRNHFPIPRVGLNTWRLRVEGATERPVEFSYEDLLKLPKETRVVTLECAGNGRAYLKPAVPGIQWGLGAVSTAEWTGVPLSAVLQRAHLKASASQVILEGLDEGEPDKPPQPAGEIRFSRSLPIEKARADVLLAYQMNDEALTPEFGFPLRAIVPGWYAMASIKWLSRLIVSEHPFEGYYQTVDYAYWKRRDGLPPEREMISSMGVKAQIARPVAGEVLRAGTEYRVHGAAWVGDDAGLAKVELSTDGGRTFQSVRLLGVAQRGAWRLWEFNWKTPSAPGRVTLMARATDSLGRTQPTAHDPDRGTYLINHVFPVEVEIR